MESTNIIYLINGQEQHLLDAIDSCGFESESYFNPCETIAEKARFSKARFYSEYAWNVERIGESKAVKEWLAGLALGIDYTNYDILENHKKWYKIDTLTERQENKILDDYFASMAGVLLDLWRNHSA